MSYTMTLDVPQETADYVRNHPRLRKDLNAIFLAVVTMRMESVASSDTQTKRPRSTAAMTQWDRLVAAGHGRLKRPYKFNRADAYDEGRG